MRFNFCPDCGEKLMLKPIGDEGDVPFCEKCGKPWFEMFPSAVIVLVLNDDGEAALLRQSYISEEYCNLVSGYMKPGESAEEAARREVKEEIGIELDALQIAGTYWYGKKDMLMIGFIGWTMSDNLTLSKEVDSAEWVYAAEALGRVHPKGSVSYALLDDYLKRSVTEEFIKKMKPTKWFANSGTPTDKYLLVQSAGDAWENWRDSYRLVWDDEISKLENTAEAIIGYYTIQDVFESVSAALDEDLRNAWLAFKARRGFQDENDLDDKIIETVKRDICWAAVENAINGSGFFTDLLHIYSGGYFPCGRDGDHFSGKYAVI